MPRTITGMDTAPILPARRRLLIRVTAATSHSGDCTVPQSKGQTMDQTQAPTAGPRPELLTRNEVAEIRGHADQQGARRESGDASW